MTQHFAISRRQFLASLVAIKFIQPKPCLLPGVPKPKFWFGQEVETSWICNDHLVGSFGDRVWMIGRVTGLVWNFDENESYFGECWSYHVEFFKTHPTLTDDVGCRLLLAEEELHWPSIDQKLI